MKVPLVLFGVVVVAFVVMGGLRSCNQVVDTSSGDNLLHSGIAQ